MTSPLDPLTTAVPDARQMGLREALDILHRKYTLLSMGTDIKKVPKEQRDIAGMVADDLRWVIEHTKREASDE